MLARLMLMVFWWMPDVVFLKVNLFYLMYLLRIPQARI